MKKNLFFRLLKITCSLLGIAVLPFSAISQTTPISGVVNTYHQVIEIIPSKGCLRVTNTGALIVNTKVMVVQMKGATINTSNSNSFGIVTSYNEAGNYEIGTICFIIGDSVFLFHNLLNTYDPTAGKVQLVQFAEYYSANVVDTVKAQPWSNTTGTGGVIAIYCEEDLTLTKPIFADASGCSGGKYLQSNGTCVNNLDAYYYNATNSSPQNGAYKGEGIAEVITSQSGGRGSPANGGGGGNNHNNSGGGGANLNNGGDGGGNSSSTGCTTTLKGIGGKALNSFSGQKIFIGGGGGAGHSNNGLSNVSGGSGGGIIFIWAKNLLGNGNKISANGFIGGNSLSDGAGGGGAGGSIIMHVTNYTGSLSIVANGGNGGASDDGGNIKRCFGGGGGGSGGVIYFTGTIPAVTVSTTGGSAGLEIGRDPSCAAAQPASVGNNGQVISSYTFARSTDPAGYCKLLLPVKLTSFTASLTGQKVLLQWIVQNPEQVKSFILERSTGDGQWQALQNVTASDQKYNYSSTDNNLFNGTIFYRLRIIEIGGSVSYSPTRVITNSRGNVFNIYPNPSDGIIFIRSDTIPFEIKIMDSNGRVLFQQKIVRSNAPFDIRSFQKGVYFIKVGETVKKLVIN